MTNTTQKEWKAIINNHVYIYGAAKTAMELYSFITEQGYKNSVKGFLVTEGKDNPKQLLGLPVTDIHVFTDKEANIVVPHLGVYKEQISNLLQSLGFLNVYLVGQLMTKTLWEEKRTITDINAMENQINQEEFGNKEICRQIQKILKEGSPDFGSVVPYQSMELIGLEGMRPTNYRIFEYGLMDILKCQYNVLDIGCNSGFLDMSIAKYVHSVTGIEYDKSLVKVGELVKNHLKVSNCFFYNGDFKDWYKQTNMTYDVIFSFAIHHWLNLSSQEYVTILDSLLAKDGYICFESHIYGKDNKFGECNEKFQELGYKILCDKIINDNGWQEREYILLQKMNN